MNGEIHELEPGTEIEIPVTPIERARQALAFSDTKTQLVELAKKSEAITEITNPAGFQECHAARMRLKNMRLEIKKRAEEAREDANAFSRSVIATQGELISVIEPEEKRLERLQDGWEATQERQRQEKQEAERKRRERAQAQIETIRKTPRTLNGEVAPTIALAIEHVKSIDLSQIDEDFRSEAQIAQRAAIEELVEMHGARLRADEEAAQNERTRAELARQKADQDAEDARRRWRIQQEDAINQISARPFQFGESADVASLIDASAKLLATDLTQFDDDLRERAAAAITMAVKIIDTKAREAAERVEQEARERRRVAQQERLAEIARMPDEFSIEEADEGDVASCIDQLRDLNLSEFDDQDRAAAEIAVVVRRLQGIRAELLERAAAAERVRLDREEREQRQREIEAQERLQAIHSATLLDAAGEALTLLCANGFAEDLATLKLAAAIDREQRARNGGQS